MFEKESSDLASRFGELAGSNAAVESERKALEQEKASLEGVLETARSKTAVIEQSLPSPVSRLPEVIQTRLKPLTERLPQDPSDTRIQTGVGGEIQVRAASDLLFTSPLNTVIAGVEDLGDGTERLTLRTESPVTADTTEFWETSLVIP